MGDVLCGNNAGLTISIRGSGLTLATSTSSSSNRPPAVLWRPPPEPRLLRLPPPCLDSTAASTSTCALTATMLTDQTAKLPWTGCTWQSRTLPQPLQPLDVALLSSPRKPLFPSLIQRCD